MQVFMFISKTDPKVIGLVGDKTGVDAFRQSRTVALLWTDVGARGRSAA